MATAIYLPGATPRCQMDHIQRHPRARWSKADTDFRNAGSLATPFHHAGSRIATRTTEKFPEEMG